MFVSTSGTSTKSPVSCYLDNNRGQLKRENKLACQNINQKQEELVVKETVQDHKMEVVCDRDLLKRGVLCVASIKLFTLANTTAQEANSKAMLACSTKHLTTKQKLLFRPMSNTSNSNGPAIPFHLRFPHTKQHTFGRERLKIGTVCMWKLYNRTHFTVSNELWAPL